jgi:hypothetical protein
VRFPWSRPTNAILKDLLVFVDEGSVPPRLFKICREVGRMELRYAALRLIGWLESQVNPETAEKPLDERTLLIDPKYHWCQNLLRLLDDERELGQFFMIEGGELRWQDEIAFSEQLALVKQVRHWRKRHGS